MGDDVGRDGSFVHENLPGRIVFGAGRLEELPAEVARLGLGLRVLVLSTARRRPLADRAAVLVLSTARRRPLADRAAALLGNAAADIFDGAQSQVPAETAAAGRAAARAAAADGTVAVGGGGVIGLAKALALDPGLPSLAVPTTYSGSEMTPIWGLTEGGEKRTGRDGRVLPKTVIYDPELTLGLPPRIAGPSGINAIAHAVEALYAADASPLTSLVAEAAIRALAAGLPRVAAAPNDLDARAETLRGAWLAGASLGTVSMGLHHKLCHVLGGSFGLPHAETHTVLLPHAAAFNAPAAGAAMARAARALGADWAPAALYDLARSVGAKTALADIGMKAADLDRAAALATERAYPNPRPFTQAEVRALLEDAQAGRRPEKPG